MKWFERTFWAAVAAALILTRMYDNAYYEKRQEMYLSLVERMAQIHEQSKELLVGYSFKYETCLKREQSRLKLWKRKMKNHSTIVKLNRERRIEWQRKERQKIRDHFSLLSRITGGLEKLTIPYKLEYQTF